MADNNDLLMRAIGELSEEEIGTLLDTLGARKVDEKEDAPDPAKFADDIADRLVKKAQSEAPKQVPAAPQQAQAAPPEFSQDEYAKLLVADARKAQAYLEKSTYGMPVSQVVPALAAAMAGVINKIQELETHSFSSRNSEYQGNRAVVDQIIAERGWQPSSQSLEDALMIAKGRGLIGQSQEEAPVARPGVPPRLPRGRGKEQPQMTEELILQRAGEMGDEELENLLFNNGMIAQRHLT